MAEQQAIGKALLISDDVIKRLDEADKKINKIAEDSDNMAKTFSSAMTKMGNDTSKFIEKLTSIQNKISGLDVSKFAKGVADVGKGVDQVEKFASAITRAAVAINKYNSAQSKNDSSKQISALNKEIEALKKKTEQLQKLISTQNRASSGQTSTRAENKAIDAYNRAMASSEAIVTQRINKIAKLRQAEEMLVKTGKDYSANISRIRAEIERLNKLNQGQVDAYGRVVKSQHNLMNTSDQLMRKLALVFSVSQIQGYIEKLIKVRGEFELQNTALASILQNKEKADLLFGRITELAVKSPFTVKELVTYTKSLSAYQVEYEKLYDTTKMLADVSAGLGVDMQRLILAFGQVKAANFLRGTETRQFTEAGINMLGELAKYYSELEGRIVSVSEVQDRQFKKMIAFKDVEEVFKRLTSAGGMFYNMQEKQAETLAGQWSNLQDSIDIMLNDIGTEKQGTLSGMISAIKSIIENWRTVADVVEPIVTILLTQRLLVKGIVPLVSNIGEAFKVVTTSIRSASVAQEGFNAAAKANAWITVGSIIIAAIWEVVNATKAAKREQEELNKITSQGYYDAISSATNYERLANVVASSTASYQEQKDALDELKRTYSEILPQHYLEADAIKAMKGNYEEATAAIKNYIRAKTEEKAIQQINEFENEKINKSQANLAEVIQKQISNSTKYKLSISEINNQLALFRDAFDKGLIKSVDDAENKLNELFSKYLNQDIKLFNAKEGSDYGRLISYYARIAEYQKKINEVSQQGQLNFGDRITQQLQKQREEVETQIKEANSMLDLIATKFSGGAGSELITDKQVSDAKAKLIEYANAWGIPEEKIKELKGGAYEISQISKEFNVAALKTFASEIGRMKLPTNQLASARMYLQGIQNEINGLNPTPLQKYVSNIILSVAQLNNVSLDGLVDAFARADENIGDYSKRIKGTMDTLTEQLNLYKKAPMLTGWTAEDAKNAEKQKKVLEAVYKGITPDTDKDVKKRQAAANKAHKSELDKLKERIELIKKVGEEYKKLRNVMSEEEASNTIKTNFADEFNNANLSITMDFDESGVIKKLEGLFNKAGKAGRKLIDKAVAEAKTEKEIRFREEGLDEIQDKVDKIFSDYEFSLDMKTEGIDMDAFKNMLKAVGASDKEISSLGLSTTSFEEAQKQIRQIIDDLQKTGGEKQIEEAKKIQKQLTDLEVKEAKKRFNELLTLREKYQSNENKIAKVETDIEGWQKELDAMNQMGNAANKEQKELLELRIQNGKDVILQLKSEALQLTEFWRQLFGDLGDLSVNSLRDLSRIVDEIVSSSKEIKGANGETAGYSASYKDRNGVTQQVTLTVEQYQRLLKQNNSVADEIQRKNPFVALMDAIRKGKKEGESALDYILRLQSILQDIVSSTFEVANNIADIFVADEDTKEFLSNIEGVANGVVNLGTGIMQIKNGDIWAGIQSAASGLSSIASSLTAIHDNKKEREIERQQILVESLQRSYEKLYDTIENGLSLDTYSQNAALIQNLQKQVNSYQAMIAAEQDKKNTDNDKIRDWQNSIEDIYTQMDELYDNLKTSLVGDFRSVAEQLGDAIAEAFQNGEDAAEAWGESVNEIVADIVQNLLVQKLIEPKVQEILDQMFEAATPNTNAAAAAQEKINSLQEEYAKLLQGQASGFTSVEQIYSWRKRKEELEKQIAELQKQYEELNAAAEGEVPNITQDIIDQTLGSLTDLGDEVLNNPAWDMLKELLQGASGDTMSGLQKGIEGISEETGQALEALLNSMRFYVADTNADIKNIYNFLVNMPIESPLMQEMKVQSNYLSSINSLLNSVSKNVPSNGRALKVQIV